VVRRIAEDAAADRREGDGADLVLDGEGEARTVAGGQQLGLALAPSPPDGSHRVDHEAGRKPVALGDLGLPRLAASQMPALLQQLRAGGTVDGTVDPSPSQQRAVGCVDDGVHHHTGDVPLEELHPAQRHRGLTAHTTPASKGFRCARC
jgi:hypothetical protein